MKVNRKVQTQTHVQCTHAHTQTHINKTKYEFQTFHHWVSVCRCSANGKIGEKCHTKCKREKGMAYLQTISSNALLFAYMLKENFRIFLQLLPLKAGVCSNKTYAKSEASSCNENHFKIHTLHIMHLTKFFLRRKESQHHVNKHLKFSVDFQFMWAMDFNNIFRWKLIDGSRNLNRKISRRC